MMIVANGTFEGRGGHDLRGTFVIEKRSADYWLVTDNEFYFDGSPEPGFALSKSSVPSQAEAHATRFHDLPSTGSLFPPQLEVRGVQECKIGPDFNPLETKSVFLWCFLTPFLLGVGKLVIEDE